jgi:hypothetical protein
VCAARLLLFDAVHFHEELSRRERKLSGCLIVRMAHRAELCAGARYLAESHGAAADGRVLAMVDAARADLAQLVSRDQRRNVSKQYPDVGLLL